MHVVRLLSPKLENETHTKDIDFSPAGINNRWEAGHADTKRALEQQAWIGEWGLLDGVVLHESRPGAEPASEMEPGKPSGFSGRSPQASRPNRGGGHGRMHPHIGDPALRHGL